MCFASVTIIDGTEVIIGYYPKKLIPALGLDEAPIDLSGAPPGSPTSISGYQAAARATASYPRSSWHSRCSGVRKCCGTPSCTSCRSLELAYTSRTRGSMNTDDMRACKESVAHLTTPDEIAAYAEKVPMTSSTS